jgi:hypothetical protein
MDIALEFLLNNHAFLYYSQYMFDLIINIIKNPMKKIIHLLLFLYNNKKDNIYKLNELNDI